MPFSTNPNDGKLYERPQRVANDGSTARPPVLVMRTDASPVTGGASSGWVSGTLALLAGNATTTVVFDMGADWDQYGLVALSITGTAAITSITPYGSDDGAANAQGLLSTALAAYASTSLAGAGSVPLTALPAGRYVRVVVVNAAAAQGAGASMRLVAYPA